jgi:hypothetical protein
MADRDGTSAHDAFVSDSHEADLGFAPALQRGLQRLAKPWYRRTALRVFLDRWKHILSRAFLLVRGSALHDANTGTAPSVSS